jgi:hypothetical protein
MLFKVKFSNFSLAFHEAIIKWSLDTQFGSFDASVVEINKNDLKVFLETVCGL